MTAPPAAQICSCADKKSDGTRDRCAAGQQLWNELIEARDALRENQGSGSRVGRKPAIDEFARRRDTYHEHLKGEASWERQMRRASHLEAMLGY